MKRLFFQNDKNEVEVDWPPIPADLSLSEPLWDNIQALKDQAADIHAV